MTALAVAFVIVALVAAVAYAGPKFYWYSLQGKLMREQAEADAERFAALKASHDLNASSGESLIKQLGPNPGQYL
jgi:hypothetical protein